MKFQPSQHSYGGPVSWYLEAAPQWTPVGYFYESKAEKAAREANEAAGKAAATQYAEAIKAASLTAALTGGGASPTGGGGGAAPAPGQPPPPSPPSPWFWPAVIIGGSLAVGAAIWFWPTGKKS